MPGAGARVVTGCRVLGAGAGCCELAVRVVERVPGAGCLLGAECWVLVLALHVADTGFRCRVAGARCVRGGDWVPVPGAGAGCARSGDTPRCTETLFPV